MNTIMNTYNMILDTMKAIEENGNVFIPLDELFARCAENRKDLSKIEFSDELALLIENGLLAKEEDRLYFPRVKEYEDAAANALAELRLSNQLPHTPLPDKLIVGDDIVLTDEQRQAVSLALDHHMSIIQGGAGSGKTTLVQAIIQQYNTQDGPILLCAPTGKAACNLQQRTKFSGRTIHSAFQSAYRYGMTLPYGLVIIDEAGMVSLEMLNWILATVRSSCRVVLVGDPNQLPSVGCGNIMEDLLELEIPHICLKSCHRQKDPTGMLTQNVRNFDNCLSMGGFGYGPDFMFFPQKDEKVILQYLCEVAISLYLEGEDVQVLSPYKSGGLLSAASLNQHLQRKINPKNGEENFPVHDGDRVMVIQNNWKQNVYNGDTGTLHLVPGEGQEPLYQFTVTGGKRQAIYDYNKVMEHLALAYATTVHKVQGSEFDTIILPVSKGFSKLWTRNLLYTAVSRASKRVILIGDSGALEFALKNTLPQRRSMLAEKANRLGF